RPKRSKKLSGTKAERLLEQSTFFTDECLGRQVGEALRAVGLRVELHADNFDQGIPDVVWLPAVGARSWVVITKDKAIRRKRWEMEKVLSAGVRMFTLCSGDMTGDEMARVFVDNRLRMGRFLKHHSAPFVAVVSRTRSLWSRPNRSRNESLNCSLDAQPRGLLGRPRGIRRRLRHPADHGAAPRSSGRLRRWAAGRAVWGGAGLGG